MRPVRPEHAGRSALVAVVLTVFPAVAARAQVWVEQGPGPNTAGQVEGMTDGEVVGAINTIAAHPSDPNVLYAGGVNGGIWRTANATAASPSWVEQLGVGRSLSIGSIEFDPNDATNQTLLAGSGRFSSFGTANGGDRVGVWRTTDAGTTWTNLNGGGTITGLNVSGVAPRGATLVVSGNTGTGAATQGVWRSTDTGGTFTRISGGVGTGLPAGAAFDLASDPSNTARLFTHAGTAGIYRSTDTGATWTKVSDAAVDAVLTAGGLSRVEIAVGTANNVFVAIVNAGRLAGLFRSPDAGGTWAALDLPTTTESGVVVGIHPGGQGGTHLSIAADPTDADVVYIGGDRQPYLNEFTTGMCPCFPNSIGANDYSGRLFRVDAGLAAGTQATHITHTNTTSGSAPHGDSRDMAVDANGDLLESDDGGVYRRTTPQTNAGDWASVIGTLRVTELHSLAWDSRSKMAIGGAQDTGTPQQTISGGQRWASVSTADGGDTAVNDTGTAGSSTRYSSNQRLGSFRRRTYDTAGVFSAQVLPALTVVGGGAALGKQFVTPIAVNNVTPTRLVIGGSNSIYESLDQGDTITEIGVGIVANGTGRDTIAYGGAGNADMLYVGAGDDVFVRNAAAPAALTASATYPGAGTLRNVAGIALDPANPQTAFVADTSTVHRTTDGGATWTTITGNLGTLSPGTLISIAYSSSNADGSVIVGSDVGVFVARGPTFDAWAALGTGLPRVPVFELEYDPADEILAAGLLGRGAWTINLAERDPVDVALVLDLSGSMLSPACPTCDTKLQVLKDSVELFIQLWTVLAIPDDRFAVNYFRTNIAEFMVGPNALVPVLPNAAAIIADVQAQTTAPANLTAMGGGLQTAVNRMTDATRPRNVILFTDGMQNVNPMVDDTTFEIANQAGKPASNVNPTVPPTDLNTALGIKVNTIGVGATPAFVDLLDDIASQTNGLTKLTTAPDEDLRRFYVEELVDALRQFSPQLVEYRRGQVIGEASTESFTTNVSARRVVFELSWKRGAQLGLSVEKDGVDLTRYGRLVSGPFYRIFAIDVPTTVHGRPISSGGPWTLRVKGAKGTPYELAALVDEAALEYAFSVGGADHVAGDALPLNVRLELGGLPVTDATVTAQVLAPKKSLGTLLATTAAPVEPAGFQYEPAASAAQRKYQLLLGDDAFRASLVPVTKAVALSHSGAGSYTASFTDTSLTGIYTVVFRVRGQRADIGSYDRTETRSVTVRFGRAVRAASDLFLVAVGAAGDGRRHDLHVRPVDAIGNFLGPDYGHRVKVSVNGVHLNQAPRDLLDGSYAFALPSTGTGDPNVVVTVMGEPLYDGPLSGLPGAVGRRWAVSAHLGVAVPVDGFPSQASTDLLWEIDLEHRATPSFSIEGVFGRYAMGGSDSLTGVSLYAKAYRPAGSWRLFGAFGPGVFKPDGGSADFGASVAAGVNRPFGPRLELDAGAGYTHVFSPGGRGFLSLRVGLKATF